MTLYALALTLFLVANPIGNSPTMMTLVKHYPFDRQKKIIFREGIIAFIIALFFQFFGEMFLSMLRISDYALTLTGGSVLFLVALQMLFHGPEDENETALKKEPFIVPIATPLISGPGLMTTIMVNSRLEGDDIKMTLAIVAAWIGVMIVLVGAPYLQKLIGKRGLSALEQVMGMILGLISMQMIVNGAHIFVTTLKS